MADHGGHSGGSHEAKSHASTGHSSGGGPEGLIAPALPHHAAEGLTQEILGAVIGKVIEPGIVETGTKIIPPDQMGQAGTHGG